MSTVPLVNASTRSWRSVEKSDGATFASGFAHLDGKHLDAADLAEALSGPESYAKVDGADAVARLNGSFAVVAQRTDGVFAAVDRVRSIPLFYGIDRKGDVVVSDDARAVARRLQSDRVATDAVTEFLLTGYVAGSETLREGIHQLQAGECLWAPASTNGRTARIVKERYAAYDSVPLPAATDEDLRDQLDHTLTQAFERLAASAEGRTLVVPLSGGLDSRLVATVLKRIGYSDVLCYAYGKAESRDCRKSAAMADRLGFRWLHVPYSRRQWHRWYRSEAWANYSAYAGNLSSVPHIDEWGALRVLREQELVPDDAIFVPGHTGDFVSSGHLYYFYETPGPIGKQRLVDCIVNRHYALWPPLLEVPAVRERMEARVNSVIEGMPLNTEDELTAAYQHWEWQERQAKFIVNAVRGYEFWGYDWRLPLWDAEIMDFWCRVPRQLKVKKGLYKSYLLAQDRYGVYSELAPQPRGAHPLRSRAGRIPGVRKLAENLARKRYYTRKAFLEYFYDPLGVLGIHDYLTVSWTFRKRRNINSILAWDYVREHCPGAAEDAAALQR